MVGQAACRRPEIVLGRTRLRLLGGLEARAPNGGQAMKDVSYLMDYGDLLARFCLSFVFLWSGISKALHPAAGKAEVAALGLPDAGLFLWLTVACQIAGGLMVLSGFWARLGALALLGFTVMATLLAHGTRGLTGDKRVQQETTTFEHLAIVGGFLFVVVHGAGRLSVDNLLQ